MNTYGSYTSCVSYINMHGTSCCMKDMHVYKKNRKFTQKKCTFVTQFTQSQSKSAIHNHSTTGSLHTSSMLCPVSLSLNIPEFSTVRTKPLSFWH